MEGQNAGWRLTGFYGEPSWDKRHLSWQYIHDLHNSSSLPWLIVGDFNEILLCDEKEGGNDRPSIVMQNFRECLDDCGLVDLGYVGDKFTLRRGDIRE